jgi:uncharacterized protein
MTDGCEITGMVSEMNRSTPVNRRLLSDYLESGDLFFRTRSGEICDIDRSEIDFLASICTGAEAVRLRLPILIGTDVSGEAGSWKVEGDTEVSVISRILGRRAYRGDYMQIYYTDLLELRRRLPTLTAIIFVP